MASRAGRYLLHDPIASGGMATVHLGRVVGTGGFSRIVAIKRLHEHLAGDPEFAAMFLDEARLASRIHHPNVVATLDVTAHEGELLLVMEHVLGDSWWHLLRKARDAGEKIPLEIVTAVVCGMLHGLHAAHEATSADGAPLELVHRDVSPHNVIVGADGIPRVVDFGIAKAVSRSHSTQNGELRGKLAYMAPEQLRRQDVDRRVDVYAAGVVLWESLTGARLFKADDPAVVIAAVLEGAKTKPSTLRPDVPAALDDVVMRALAIDRDARPATAMDLANAIEAIVPPASPRTVAAFVAKMAEEEITERRRKVAAAEQMREEDGDTGALPPSMPVPMSGDERRALAAAETQVSVVAATNTDTVPDAKPASRARAVAILLALTIAGSAGAFLMAKRARSMADSATSTPNISVRSAASSTGPAETPVGPPPKPTPEPTPTPTPTNDAGSDAGPRPGPKKKKRADCSPAYTLDAEGVKHFKPQCL